MNDQSDSLEKAHAESKSGVHAQALSSARRRRFIKLGASTVPISLTLSSRPVMAWHCNTTSAWGSQQLAPTAASVQARLDDAVVNGSETWAKTHWRTNTKYGTVTNSRPFEVLAVACNFKDSYKTVKGKQVLDKTAEQNCIEKCTLAQAFGSGAIRGAADNLKVWDAVRGQGGASEFVTYMTIALLNMKLTPGAFKTRLNQCFRDANGMDQIVVMAKAGPGNYVPTGLPAGTPAWSWNKTRNYLIANWLVVEV